MAFEIRLDRNAPREIRRVVREQVDLAITGLNSAREGHPAGIHDARKRFKAIRAVLRLVAPQLGNYYARENVWYRNTARKLATVRDAQARLETLDRLVEVRPKALRPERLEALREKLEERSQALHEEQLEDAETIDGLVEDLVVARERIKRWPLKRKGYAAIGPGLESTYRRGRQGFRQAGEGTTALQLHEWRKQVKYHRHHVRLLKDLWPEVMLGASATLRELSDLLGNHHDLHDFQTLIGKSPELVRGKRERETLLASASDLSRDLERRVAVIGGLVYAEKPVRFSDRMAAYWSARENGNDASSSKTVIVGNTPKGSGKSAGKSRASKS